MSPTEFRDQIAQLTAQLAGRPLDAALDTWLNAEHGVGSALVLYLLPKGEITFTPRAAA